MQPQIGGQQLPGHGAVEHQGAGWITAGLDPAAIGAGQGGTQQALQSLGRQGAHHLISLQQEGAPGRAGALQAPAPQRVGLQPLQPVPQAQLAAGLGQGKLQGLAQLLHRALEVPKAQRRLGHGQHRGAIQSCGAIGGLL